MADHIKVSDALPRVVYAVGSTPTQAFAVPFALPDAASLRVLINGEPATRSDSPTTALEFSFSGTAMDGGYESGTVTLGATITDATVILLRDIPIRRDTDYPYPSQVLDIRTLNGELDRIVMVLQQQARDIGRSVRLNDEDPANSLTILPLAARAGRYAIWDADGNLSALPEFVVLPTDMPVYGTRSDALLVATKANGPWLRTEGYTTAGDGGGAQYRWVASSPKPGSFAAADADGYFEPIITGLCVPEQFGAIPDNAAAWSTNTTAFTDFFNYLNSFAEAPQDGYASFGWLYPGGHVFGRKYWLGNVKILTRSLTGLGMAKFVLHPSADPDLALFSSVDMPAPGITKMRWSNLSFQGAGIHFQNDNIDGGECVIDGCKFYDTAHPALYFEDAYSTCPIITNCHFARCNGIVYTDCDRTTIEHSWLIARYTNWDDDTAMLVQSGQPGRTGGGVLHSGQVFVLNNLTCVPVVFDATPTRQVSRPRWLDLRGEVQANAVRSGGENGGIPALRFWQPYETGALAYNSRGGSIIWYGGDLYVNSSQSDDGVSWGAFLLCGHLPVNVDVRGPVGPMAAPLIVNDGNFIADFDAYFTTWRGVSGHTDETQYFRWNIDLGQSRPVARMWPSGLSKLVRQAPTINVAFAYRTASQSITAGATATKVALTAAAEEDSALFSASDEGFVIQAAGWYQISGQVRTNSSGAASNTTQATIQRNGTDTVFGSRAIASASGQALVSVVNGLILCAVGDKITLGVIKTGNDDQVGMGASTNNHLQLVGPWRRTNQ